MATSTTIGKIKTDLRISHNKLDSQIGADIDGCLKDLEITAGVKYPNESDELIFNAIRLWCRMNYTDDTTKASAYQERYNDMKASLQMTEGYGLE